MEKTKTNAKSPFSYRIVDKFGLTKDFIPHEILEQATLEDIRMAVVTKTNNEHDAHGNNTRYKMLLSILSSIDVLIAYDKDNSS